MALLNAVEYSVHLHGPARLPVVAMNIAKHLMTAVKESGFFFTSFVSSPQVVR